MSNSLQLAKAERQSSEVSKSQPAVADETFCNGLQDPSPDVELSRAVQQSPFGLTLIRCPNATSPTRDRRNSPFSHEEAVPGLRSNTTHLTHSNGVTKIGFVAPICYSKLAHHT